LAILILLGSTLRLAIENFMKYGILITLPGRYIPIKEYLYAFVSIAGLCVNVTVSLILEKLLAKPQTSLIVQKIIPVFHIVNIIITVALPSYVAYTFILHPFLAMAPVFLGTILALKLISFVLVNADLRRESKQRETIVLEDEQARIGEVKIESEEKVFNIYANPYPSNLNFRNMLYFWAAPTLCYQTSYPRTPRFRKKFFIKRVLEVCISLATIYFLTEQYAGK